jgi:translocator protein|tara:strand:+ start:48256 stop:49074 length:819 start_codon:yes stop_codon:yes gene_type:complete
MLNIKSNDVLQNKDKMVSSKMSHAIALTSLTILLSLYYGTSVGFFGLHPIGTTSISTTPLIVPEGFAFSIWGVIYTGLILFPIYQIIRVKNMNEWIQVRLWYALNVLLNGLWLVCASYDWLWTTVAIIFLMLFSLIKINILLVQIKKARISINYWMESLVFSVYFGWITLAAVLNIAAALSYHRWDGMGLQDVTWSYLILTVASTIVFALFRYYRDNAFALVSVWAFFWLMIRHWSTMPLLAYFSGGIMGFFALLVFLNFAKEIKNRGKVSY